MMVGQFAYFGYPGFKECGEGTSFSLDSTNNRRFWHLKLYLNLGLGSKGNSAL